MSYEQTREVLDSTLETIRRLESLHETYEGATAEEIMGEAVALADELAESPEQFTEQDRHDYSQEIDDRRGTVAWMSANLPDYDGSTSYAESYLADALDIEVQGRYDEERQGWEPTVLRALISFGGPTVWITGPHGSDDDLVEVAVSWWSDTQTARTYAPHLAEHLAGILECYAEVSAR